MSKFLFTTVYSPRDFPILPAHISWKRRKGTLVAQPFSESKWRSTEKAPTAVLQMRILLLGFTGEEQVWHSIYDKYDKYEEQ